MKWKLILNQMIFVFFILQFLVCYGSRSTVQAVLYCDCRHADGIVKKTQHHHVMTSAIFNLEATLQVILLNINMKGIVKKKAIRSFVSTIILPKQKIWLYDIVNESETWYVETFAKMRHLKVPEIPGENQQDYKINELFWVGIRQRLDQLLTYFLCSFLLAQLLQRF